MDEDEYSRILGRYPALASEIAQNTVLEGSGEENTHGGVCGACIDTMPRDPINNT